MTYDARTFISSTLMQIVREKYSGSYKLFGKQIPENSSKIN